MSLSRANQVIRWAPAPANLSSSSDIAVSSPTMSAVRLLAMCSVVMAFPSRQPSPFSPHLSAGPAELGAAPLKLLRELLPHPGVVPGQLRNGAGAVRRDSGGEVGLVAQSHHTAAEPPQQPAPGLGQAQ